MAEYIPGYHNEIYQSLWRRPLVSGAPRMWSHAWMAICAALALQALFLFGFKWLAIPVVLWMVGQGVLAFLTHWDEQFDDIVLSHLTRSYRKYYDAG
jgi:type IV secretory pathway TrbD component